jgi:hypothetical protein
MSYDFTHHRYILTQKDVMENLGIDIEARLTVPNAIPALLNRISVKIYSFIHTHNVNNQLQDYIIAKTESGRRIIREAMEEQLIYFLTVGDLSRSVDEAERRLAIDQTAIDILLQPIPEIGCSILYCGTLPCVKFEGEY